MIARLWRGWAASTEAADLYEAFLRTEFLPSAHAIEGYRGASVLRRAVGGERLVVDRRDALARDGGGQVDEVAGGGVETGNGDPDRERRGAVNVDAVGRDASPGYVPMCSTDYV